MAEIIGEVIGGVRFRSVTMLNGYNTDPLVNHDLPGRGFSISTTRMPPGTAFEEHQDEGEMIKKIKNKKFKASDLSEYTKEKFKTENIAFEDDQGEDDQ